MKLRFHLVKNQIAPALRKQLKAATKPAPALRAAGEVLVQMAKRSFDEPALRAAPWRPLKASTLRQKARKGKSSGILKSSGTLWRSLRVIGLDATSVTIGSDRPYAAYHQLGTRHIPARPFFPVTSQGKLTRPAKIRVEAAIQKKLGLK